MNQLWGQKNNQQNADGRAVARRVHDTHQVLFFLAVSFLLLAAVPFWAGTAFAAPQTEPLTVSPETKNDQTKNDPESERLRLAQASGSFENWQKRAFKNINLKRRLKALAEEKKRNSARQRRRASQKKQAKKKRAIRLQMLRTARKRTARRKTLKGRSARRKATRSGEPFSAPVRSVRLLDADIEISKIQHCLKKIGYFKGMVSGLVDDATLNAFLDFADEHHLQDNLDGLDDPKMRKAIFSRCTDHKTSAPKQTIADAANAGPETQATSLKKTAPVLAKEDTDFARDILAATKETQSQPSTDLASRAVADLGQETNGGTSSRYGSKRSKPAFSVSSVVDASGTKSKHPRKLSFSKRLSMFDLAQAKPINPNTCSAGNQDLGFDTRRTASGYAANRDTTVYMARAYGDGPATTGAIASGFANKSNFRAQKHNFRLGHVAAPVKPCLPKDLHDLLTKTHGRKKDISVCKTDCLPAPVTFSEGQREFFANQYKINWCGANCLEVAEPLPLAEVMKIERRARVHVCMKPQEKMASTASKGTGSAIQSLYDKLPGGYGNADNIAVIIGNKNYANASDLNAAGHVNAAAMQTLLVEQMGYKKTNIIYLEDAKKADFIRLFGTRSSADGELRKRLEANPDAQLLIYFSGHASSSGLGMDNYLLPVDAVAGIERKTAYSLNILYDNLRTLDARTTQLFLETSFNVNRTSIVQPPNIAERRVNISPINSVRGLAIFTAATGDQKSLIDPETGIGLFTRHLVSGLAGEADERPIGNGDRTIDSVELHVHLASNVSLAARKTLGLRQRPTLSRTDNLFLSQLSRKRKR